MNDANVYAPPETDIRQATTAASDGPRLGPDEAKRLYNHSRSIGALVFLWCVGLLILAAIFVPNMMAAGRHAGARSDDLTILLVVIGGIALVMVAGIIGCWRRTSWGRTVGFILCALMLLNFWIGTLIGIFGLIALANGAKLFGPDRLTHRQLAEMVTYYKSNRRRGR